MRTPLIAISAFNAGLAFEDIMIYYDYDKALSPPAAILSAVIVTGLVYGAMWLLVGIGKSIDHGMQQ